MQQPDKSIAQRLKKAAALFTRWPLLSEPKSPDGVAAEDTAEPETSTNPQVGDKMPDGSIFAGISPNTGKQMFAMPKDAAVTMTFHEAQKYALQLNILKILGHTDWRVPTKEELNLLFQNYEKGSLRGTFNVTGATTGGWYWSSTRTGDHGASGQRFRDGLQTFIGKSSPSSVRCVR